MRASLLISTYNWPWALERVLWSVFAQSRHDFEIVIADDGSKPETSALIAQMAPQSPVPITHVWQPDEGFGKCRALNKSLAASRGERIIVTDGDCVLRRDFVDTHIKQARPGTFLAGSYFKLPDPVSQSVDEASIANQQVFTPKWLVEHGMSSSPRLWAKVGAPRPLAWLLDRLSKAKPSWNGHSASCLRSEALQVNGFNEEMGYGGLDVEFGLRLNHTGLRARRIRFSTVALHLHHERGYATPRMRENSERVKERTRSESSTWAKVGLDQWLDRDSRLRHGSEDVIRSFASQSSVIP